MTPLSCVSPPRNSTAQNSLQCQKTVGSAETEHLSTVIQCSSLPRRLRNPLLHPPSPAPPPPPLSTLSWSIQRGNDGGLVTARSTPGLSRQSHPREAAPNWADAFFAAAEANESQLALHPRGPAGLGFKKNLWGGRGEKGALWKWWIRPRLLFEQSYLGDDDAAPATPRKEMNSFICFLLPSAIFVTFQAINRTGAAKKKAYYSPLD